LEAEISLQYPSALFAKSVMSGISPENKLARRRMQVYANVNGKTLNVLVKHCERIETLQATVQDIFRCIRAAESSLMKLSSSQQSR
jgi:hypothetical protein